MSNSIGSFPLVSTTPSSSPLQRMHDHADTSRTAAIAARTQLYPRLFHRFSADLTMHVFSLLTIPEMIVAAHANPCTYSFAKNKGLPVYCLNFSPFPYRFPEGKRVIDHRLDFLKKENEAIHNISGMIPWTQNVQKIFAMPLSTQGLAELRNCPHLSQMEIHGWGKWGKPYRRDLSFLKDCPQLSFLTLRDMDSTDDDLDLGNCSKLHSLILKNMRCLNGRALAELQNCPQLSNLQIVGENGIIQASLASLKHCQNLSALTLELRFGITGSVLPLLQYCPRLSTLVLAEMNPYKVDLNIIHKFNQEDLKPLTDADLAILPNYPQLTELTLSGTCAITGIGLQHLRNCKQLSSLNLFDMVERCYIPLNEFPDLSSLAGCPNLKHLQFRVTQSLRDGDILALEACQQIETVDLDRVSFITQAGVDALQAKCPRLKIIFPPRRL